MTRKERWLFSISLLVAIMPFIIVASSLQMLPKTLMISAELLPGIIKVEVSKYNYLYLGLFCLVPVSLIVSARILKEKGVVGRNFSSMIISGLVLGIVFLLVSAYGVIYQIVERDIDLLKGFDFMGTVVVILSLIMGLLSNFLPDIKQNDILGIKNKHTLSSNEVWKKVHIDVNNVFTFSYYGLALVLSGLSIFLDYRYSWVHIVIWFAVSGLLFFWSSTHSKKVAQKLKKQASEIVSVNS